MAGDKRDIATRRKEFKKYVNRIVCDDIGLSEILDNYSPLQERYKHSLPKADKRVSFSSKRGTFEQLSSRSSPEKSYVELMTHPDKHLNMYDFLSESDRIKYFIAYHAVFRRFHKIFPDWQDMFAQELKEKIYQDNMTQLEQAIALHKPHWSIHQQKLMTGLVLAIHKSKSPIEQRILECYELAKEIKSGFNLNSICNNKRFEAYSDLISEADYDIRYTAIQNMIQPKLYYPQNAKQQKHILASDRHCYYIDQKTKNLYYINLKGTPILIDSSDLVSKEIESIQRNDHSRMLEYKKTTHASSSHFHVPFSISEEFGHALRVANDKMAQIVNDFHPDTLVDLTQNVLQKLHQDRSLAKESLSLFSGKKLLSALQRSAVLNIAQQIITNKPVLRLEMYTHEPDIASFAGSGEDAYLFVDDAANPDKTGLWHVDRSSEKPKLTQFPINSLQADNLRYLVAGAKNLEPPKSKYAHYDTYLKWYNLGKTSESTINNDKVSIQLSHQQAKDIPNLYLSNLKSYERTIEDWSYNEAYDQLTNTLSVAHKNHQKNVVLERCTLIQTLLDNIGDDYYAAFPATRGLVPHAQRDRMMRMMNTLVTEPDSVEANHYFRTRHRFYCESTGFVPHGEECVASSFRWEDNVLTYVDEHKKEIIVPMTSELLQKIKTMEENKDEFISADDVYYLMTRPKSFYYMCDIPVFLNCGFTYKFGVPTGFDRSLGLHTGTAREMMCELHDMHLSVRSILYTMGAIIVFVGVPMLLNAVGLGLPIGWVLSATQAAVFQWVMLVWNLSLVYHMMVSIVCKNDLMQPEFNQLDQALKELGSAIEKQLPNTLPEDAADVMAEPDWPIENSFR